MSKYQCHGVTRSGARCARTVDNSGFCKDHPFDDGLVTKTGFAKLQGVSKQMVSQWLGDSITETPGGFIEWKKAQAAIAASRDVTRPSRREDAQRPRSDEIQAHFNIAKASKEKHRARLAKMKADKMAELLVDAEDVYDDTLSIIASAREAFLTLPDRVSGQVLGMSSQREVRDLIRSEVNSVLKSLHKKFDQMSESRIGINID